MTGSIHSTPSLNVREFGVMRLRTNHGTHPLLSLLSLFDPHGQNFASEDHYPHIQPWSCPCLWSGASPIRWWDLFRHLSATLAMKKSVDSEWSVSDLITGPIELWSQCDPMMRHISFSPSSVSLAGIVRTMRQRTSDHLANHEDVLEFKMERLRSDDGWHSPLSSISVS